MKKWALVGERFVNRWYGLLLYSSAFWIWGIGACLAIPSNQQSTERIVFVSDRAGNKDLYTVRPDGTDIQQLTNSPDNEVSPKWSADGQWIYYAVRRNNIGQIYRMKADGSDSQRLSNSGINELDPAISPNGKQLAFSAKVAGNYQLHVMDIDGNNRKQLTFSGPFNARPAWSLDGQQIVFLAGQRGIYELYTIRPDGTERRQLTQMQTDMAAPAWSPNAFQILFSAHVDEVDHLFRINTNGKQLRQLSDQSGSDFHPQFNDLGNQIVFTSTRDGDFNLYIADLWTGEERQLLDWTSKEDQADWYRPIAQFPGPMPLTPALPDQLKIAFTSSYSGTKEICWMNPDGTGLEQLTQSPDDNSYAKAIEGEQKLHFLRTNDHRNFKQMELDLATKVVRKATEQAIVPDATFENKSPDGRYVAYCKSGDQGNELFVYDVQTQTERQITQNATQGIPAHSLNHMWSPDSRKIAFMSGPDWYHQFLRIYDLETDSIEVITERGYMNSGLLWNKDHRSLILNIKIRNTTTYELWSINADGSDLRQLTDNPGAGNVHPQLSPDGNWVLFESYRHRDEGEIYLMRPDGSQQTRLTYRTSYEGRPVWVELE
ncbi:MAG: DUF5050 domain-containing protein [Bacteroidota bacterium]